MALFWTMWLKLFDDGVTQCWRLFFCTVSSGPIPPLFLNIKPQPFWNRFCLHLQVEWIGRNSYSSLTLGRDPSKGICIGHENFPRNFFVFCPPQAGNKTCVYNVCSLLLGRKYINEESPQVKYSNYGTHYDKHVILTFPKKFTVHRTLILLLVWLETFQTGRKVILLQLVQNQCARWGGMCGHLLLMAKCWRVIVNLTLCEMWLCAVSPADITRLWKTVFVLKVLLHMSWNCRVNAQDVTACLWRGNKWNLYVWLAVKV
jgi:hypothetical protein